MKTNTLILRGSATIELAAYLVLPRDAHLCQSLGRVSTDQFQSQQDLEQPTTSKILKFLISSLRPSPQCHPPPTLTRTQVSIISGGRCDPANEDVATRVEDLHRTLSDNHMLKNANRCVDVTYLVSYVLYTPNDLALASSPHHLLIGCQLIS